MYIKVVFFIRKNSCLLFLIIIAYNLQAQVVSFKVGSKVTTVAGNGNSGTANGPASSAEFSWPEGLAVDATGNIYVADAANARIQKITPNGIVSTLAGSGNTQIVDGIGRQASFNLANGITMGADGNLYVSDSQGAIRKVTPEGVVTTVASNFGTNLSTVSLGFDPLGNLFVSNNRRVIKIAANSTGITTFAGSTFQGFADGQGTAAMFNDMWGICVDASGNVYVADTENNRIRKIDPSGLVTTLAGSGVSGFADGIGTAAQFRYPHGVAVDASGNVYVTDRDNSRIRKITPAGAVSTVAGSGIEGFKDGESDQAEFNWPLGITLDGQGNLLVTDYKNFRIRKITVPSQLERFHNCPDYASLPQMIYVNGSSLNSNMIVHAPLGYEVSLAKNNGYSDSLIFNPSANTIQSTPFYIRVKANGVPLPMDRISLTSAGATTQYLDVIYAASTNCPFVGSPFIPNLITPNGDGLNDAFEIKNINGPVDLKIFNRWGNQVFSSNNYLNDWKAESITSGVYYYAISDQHSTWNGWLEIAK